MAENAYAKWYRTARWKRLRNDQLARHPLCKFCEAGGLIEAATVCDHVHPHRGDETKFWTGPFQSLCRSCHSQTKQATEHGRGPQQVDADGWPV